jgi:hypothetical protein
MFRRSPQPSVMHRRLRFNPLRMVMPWVAVAFGLLMVLVWIVGTAGGRSVSAVYPLVGSGLVVLGVVAFILARWMARRGL